MATGYHQRDGRSVRGHGCVTTVSTGSYSIGNDGTGTLSFNNALLGTITLEVTLAGSSRKSI